MPEATTTKSSEPDGLKFTRVLDDIQLRVLERQDDDDEFQRVELSFFSSYEVKRWFGKEVLDPDGADFSRLNNGAAFLVNHDWDDQVGVVESARIVDGRGRAVVRFSRSARGREIAQDMIDGIRQLVSVAYFPEEMELVKSSEEEGKTYVVRRFVPFELSTVPVPADPTVGVGRALEDRFGGESEQQALFRALVRTDNSSEEPEMPERNDNTQTPAAGEPTPAAAPVNIEEVRSAAAEKERARVAGIFELGTKYGMADEALEAVSARTSLNDFQTQVLDAIAERNPETPKTHIGMSDDEVQEYSIIRALAAALDNDWSGAGLEREAHRAVEKQLGKPARGFFVPHDVQVRQNPLLKGMQLARLQQVGVPADGGALVETILDAGNFIEQLYARSALLNYGARLLQNLQGNLDLPKRVSGASFSWIAEGGEATPSTNQFGTVTLRPKTIAGAVAMTRRALMQTTPDIEQLTWSDLARGSALAIDLAGIEGDGTGETPLGVRNQTGVLTQTVAAPGAPTWEEIVGFETAVDASDALMGNLGYIMTPEVNSSLRTTRVDSGSGIFIADKMEYGRRTSSQLSANSITFGNWGDALIGMWGVLDIRPDTATLAASAGLVVRLFQDADFNIRHGQSFCREA